MVEQTCGTNLNTKKVTGWGCLGFIRPVGNVVLSFGNENLCAGFQAKEGMSTALFRIHGCSWKLCLSDPWFLYRCRSGPVVMCWCYWLPLPYPVGNKQRKTNRAYGFGASAHLCETDQVPISPIWSLCVARNLEERKSHWEWVQTGPAIQQTSRPAFSNSIIDTTPFGHPVVMHSNVWNPGDGWW